MILRKSAVQKEAINLAGLLANVNPQNLIKPDIHRRAVATNYDILEAFSGLRIGLRILINPKFFSSSATSTREGEFCASIKKGLPTIANPVYGYSAPAKSGAGIGVPVIRMATHDAPSVFFCAVSLTHPFFERWDIIQRLARAMVAQAGASSEAPVSIRAGYANPAWATTSEIGVSGGSVTRYRMEAAAWLLPSPKFRNSSGLSPLFAAICRQLPQKFTISPQRLSRKPAALWRGITFAFSPDAFAQGAYMLNYFRVAGCATARSGELVEFVYIVDARSAISAKAEALNQARNERLSHIQITRVREVAA